MNERLLGHRFSPKRTPHSRSLAQQSDTWSPGPWQETFKSDASFDIVLQKWFTEVVTVQIDRGARARVCVLLVL
jgi:hypothetical protein